MIDLTGQRFGKLTVLNMVGKDKSGNITWKCRCDCDNEVIVSSIYLRNGDTKSCGCFRKESARKQLLTHGESKTRLYKVWAGIKSRCYNPNCDNYKYYGEKGITMCEEWRDSFEVFKKWSEENGYIEDARSQECTIDRKDNAKPYSPENCRWTDHTTQCNNQTSNKIFKYNNEEHTMAEWARLLGIKYTTLRARLRRGASFEEAINM